MWDDQPAPRARRVERRALLLPAGPLPATPTCAVAASYHREAEVTRLTRDLNQAREEQTATAEVLQIISNSSGGLEAVFDAMLEKAVRMFRATQQRASSPCQRGRAPRCRRTVPPPARPLGAEAVGRIVKTIEVYDNFCHANDPYEEHNFGSFEADGHTIFFKIAIFPTPGRLNLHKEGVTIVLKIAPMLYFASQALLVPYSGAYNSNGEWECRERPRETLLVALLGEPR